MKVNVKVIIVIIIALSWSVRVFGQSKTETENWLISKFDKYKIEVRSNISASTGTMDFQVNSQEVMKSMRFDNCNLIIKTSYFNSTSYRANMTYFIKIGDISDFQWQGSALVITDKKYGIKRINIDPRNPKEVQTDFISKCRLGFNLLSEENLDSRLIKAFEHLKTFCPQTEPVKEAF